MSDHVSSKVLMDDDPPPAKTFRGFGDTHHVPPVATHQTPVAATEPAPVVNNVPTTLPPVAAKSSTGVVTDTRQIAPVATHRKTAAATRKGDRHAKHKTRLVGWIDRDIFKRIKVYCAEREITIGEFVEMVGVHHIEAAATHPPPVVGDLSPHDDLMMLFKTDEDIIRLYLQYHPGNKWNARDDAAARRYNSIDRRLLEYVIVYTQANAGFKKINSFAYYRDEMDEWAEKRLGGEALDAMVASARRAWSKAKGKS